MVTLIVLGTIFLAVYDAVVIAAFVVSLFKNIMGETPRSRLFQLLGGIGSFILYGYWALYKTASFWGSTEDVSPFGMIVPLAIPLVLLAFNYISGGNNRNNNT